EEEWKGPFTLGSYLPPRRRESDWGDPNLSPGQQGSDSEDINSGTSSQRTEQSRDQMAFQNTTNYSDGDNTGNIEHSSNTISSPLSDGTLKPSHDDSSGGDTANSDTNESINIA